MILKKFILIPGLIFLAAFGLCFAEEKTQGESDQQINEFSLSGYGEKGKKSWDLSGNSADIFTEVVKLKSVTGNLYGKEENIKLTADNGDFNKVDGKVHLEQNVIVTTSSGMKLTTDSLDWDRKASSVATKDPVNIQRDNMIIDGVGAKGELNLKKVALEKDIRLNIKPEDQNKPKGQGVKEKMVITCDGPLEIDYEKNIAVFNNNVKVEKADSIIYSDRMDVYFIVKGANNAPFGAGEQGMAGSKIDKIISRGNVKIVRGEDISYSQEAVYNALDRKITLNGRPKLVIYSSGEFKDAPLGN
ncbi:MAG: LPS export ABC transporter periplasmic protein LptC [Candidatus Omnitrophota bacterium]